MRNTNAVAERKARGRRLKQARLALALRRGDDVPHSWVAKQAGVTAVTYGRYEAGKKWPDDPDRIARLADVLECDAGWLEHGDPKPGRYAGRMTTELLSVPPSTAGGTRARRGRKPAEERGYMPRMWYGAPALSDVPLSVARRVS